jgi:hypothetical protein
LNTNDSRDRTDLERREDIEEDIFDDLQMFKMLNNMII